MSSVSFWDDPFFTPIGKFFSSDSEKMSVFKPLVDVKETDKEIVLFVELPGMKKDDIHLEFKNHRLTIAGKRSNEKKDDNEKYHRVERSYGEFRRSWMLPEGMAEKDIKAHFENGVL